MVGDALDPVQPGALELVNAALRADAGDLTVLARVLTTTLGDALPPGMVEVERKRSLADRAAGRPGEAVALRVLTGERTLELRLGAHGPLGEVHHVVGNVAISRRPVELDEWVRTLATELTARATRDTAARAALAALLGLS